MSTQRIALKIIKLTALFLSLALLAISTKLGMLMNYLLVFLMISSVAMIMMFIIAVVKKQTQWNLLGVKPIRSHVMTAMIRNATWIMIGFSIYLAIIPIQFSADEFSNIVFTIWGCVIALCLLDWMPRKRLDSSYTLTLSIILVFLSVQLLMSYMPPRIADSAAIAAPNKGDWYVLQGGSSALINHHHFAGSQKYALDLIDPEDGILASDPVADLSQYKSFGRDVYSPVKGVVIAVENTLKDQRIGETDRKNPTGNHVVIRTGANEFMMMAHLQSNSVSVAVGEAIKIGHRIGKVGNSGNTTQPHLHLQMMTQPVFSDSKSKPIPFYIADGNDEILRFYSRNDIVPGRSN